MRRKERCWSNTGHGLGVTQSRPSCATSEETIENSRIKIEPEQRCRDRGGAEPKKQ